MPPRYAYWTVILDNAPTAFRSRTKDELLPTLKQLQRRNADATLKWFQDGKLWDSPDAARAARFRARAGPRRDRTPRGEKRGREWRPGGAHRDPRARFKKKK